MRERTTIQRAPPRSADGDRHGGELIGRERELEAVAGAVAAAREGDGVVITIEGAAGIGKTALLRAASEWARERGVRTLIATGTPLEDSFAFGIARQLFEPLRRELGEEAWGELASGAAGLAARALDERALELPDPSEDPSFATLHGLYWLTANLAASRPILLAVDDIQWADRPSLRFLSHLVHRLDGVPAVVLIAVRRGEPPSDAWLLSELEATAEPRLRLGPLDENETGDLLRARLGEPADPSLCAAAHRATGGNPFLLGALIDAVRSGELDASAAAVDSLRGVRLESVAQALLRRLSVLPEGSHELVTAAAALGNESALPTVAELAGLDTGTAANVVEALREAGILGPPPEISFAHPVVRAAVYEEMPRDQRRALHVRAAQQAARRGASAEQEAVHYLAIEGAGDPSALATLMYAAQRASARGAPDVAASYLRRALAEPPPANERPRVRFQLGLAGLAAEEPDSVPHLVEAVHGLPDPRERAEAALEAATLLAVNGNSSEVISVCEAGLRLPASIDRELAAKLESEMALNSLLSPSTVELGIDWAGRRRDDDNPLTLPAATLGAAWVGLAIEGRPATEEVDRLVAMVSDGSLFRHPSATVAMGVVWVLVIGGRPDVALGVGDSVVALGEHQGSILLTSVGRFWRAVAEYDLGRIADAAADSGAAVEVALDGAGDEEGLSYILSTLIDSLIEAGDPAGAEVALITAGTPPELREGNRAATGAVLPSDLPHQAGSAFLIESRGRLRSAQGRYAEAAADLLEAGDRWLELRVRSPVPTSWRADAALALARLGDEREAARLAEEQLALARAAEEPRTLGASLRALAEVGTGAAARELLDEAVIVLERTPARLERARAELALGRVLRRQSERAAARERLGLALDLAHRGGAARIASAAREELLLAGARPRRVALTGPESLTPAERRVTEMASAGQPNREIAQALFVSLRTVETHLTHAYQKLEISSRDELPAALAGEA